MTNDPAKPKVHLKVLGKVKGYVTVAPGYIRLTGPVGRAISRSVRITALEGYPIKIRQVNAIKNEFLRWTLQPIGTEGGKGGYLLRVENTKKESGNYHDTIIITTDSKHKPELRIPVYGRIHDPQPSSKGISSK